jgi:hypothetical protein
MSPDGKECWIQLSIEAQRHDEGHIRLGLGNGLAGTDIGSFVDERVQTIDRIQDTRTIITFKAFS